jgi:beta-lactamase class A
MSNTISGGLLPGVPVGVRPILTRRSWSPLLKRLETAAIFIAVGLSVIIFLQFAYPRNWTLPGAQFGGINVGASSVPAVTEKLQILNSKQLRLSATSQKYGVPMSDMGLYFNTSEIAKQLTNYPASKRMIPFSFLTYKPAVYDNHISIQDRQQLDKFAAAVAKENDREPEEGSISYQNNRVVIVQPKPGVKYKPEAIAAYFSAVSSKAIETELTLPYEAVSPINTQQHLEELAKQAEKTVAAGIAVRISGQETKVSSVAIQRAIRFTGDPKATKLTISFDAQALTAGLEELADKVFLAPTAVAAGQELNASATAESMKTALDQGTSSAEAVLKPIPAGSGKVYAATSKGIQQLINDWNEAHESADAAIDFVEIGGMNRKANIDNTKKYFSASVYKVFPAWYVLDQIDQGKLDPNGIVAAGMKLDSCFNDMIIVSASICSEAIVHKFGGFKTMDEFAASHGIEGITLSKGVNITAGGMSQFLQKLDAGELLSPERTKYLLDAMKRQKYRQGIPTGSAGTVADKVGYQPRIGSWHDAGIVYHPKGKYTLVVLANNASLPTISTLARQISETLAR